MTKQTRRSAGRKTRPLIELRPLVLLTVSLVIGLATWLISWKASPNPWAATLVSFGAFGIALERLNDWTE
jgi:hypothetical protein